MRPLTGDLSVSPQSFTLHDATVGSNSALLTALTTKRRSEFVTTKVVTSMSSGSSTFTVENAAIYTFPRVLWVGREAINCASRSGNVITVATFGRGYYASSAEAHVVDSEQNLKPVVYDGVFRLTGRGCVLWYVDDSGNMYPEWRGEIHATSLDQLGVMVTIDAKHVSDVVWQRKLGVSNAATRLRGFDADGGFEIGVTTENTPPLGVYYSTGLGVQDDLLTLMNEICNSVHDNLVFNGVNNVWLTPGIDNNGLQITVVSYSGNNNLKLFARVGSQFQISNSQDTADPRIAIVRFDPAPEVIVRMPPQPTAVPVTSTIGIPSGIGASTATFRGSVYRVTTQPFFQGEYDDDWYVELWPSDSPVTISTNDTSIGGGPSITGNIQFTPRSPTATRSDRLWCDRAVLMQLRSRVIAGHWIYGIQTVINTKTLWQSFSDPRDWSWPARVIEPLVDATASRFASRVWTFDGSLTVGEFIAENAAAYGIGVGLSQSRLCLRSWDTPTVGQSPLITITSADLVDRPTWGTFGEGIANSASVETETQSIVVNALNSIEDYNEGKQIKVRLSGAQIDRSTSDQPRDIAHHVLSRAIGFFSDELQVVHLPLSWQWITQDLDIGEPVDFAEWLAPNGTGGRGNTSARGIVIERYVDTSTGRIEIGVLVFPPSRGYAPAAKVASVSGAIITLAAPGYVDGVTDYAGSNLSDYTGTPSDGGTSMFKVGDKVALLQYDTTSPAFEAHTINAVNAATREITLASSVGGSMVTAIGSGLVHLLYNTYTTSGLQATQKQYAWIGDRSTGVIDGTADKLHTFAP